MVNATMIADSNLTRALASDQISMTSPPSRRLACVRFLILIDKRPPKPMLYIPCPLLTNTSRVGRLFVYLTLAAEYVQ